MDAYSLVAISKITVKPVQAWRGDTEFAEFL